MDSREEKIYGALATIRGSLFKPVNKFLTAIGVTPNFISYIGVALMVGFALSVNHHPKTAYWLLIARIFADLLDGPLARYQKIDSDRGKFIDVLMDNLAFALFMVGIVEAGLINAPSALIYLYLTELVVILMIIRTNLRRPKTNWLFYASAGALPYNFIYLSYILFWYAVFFGHNYLTGSAQIFSVILAFKALKDYAVIKKSATTKS